MGLWVVNSLRDMYGKCASTWNLLEVFDEVGWNWLLCHGPQWLLAAPKMGKLSRHRTFGTLMHVGLRPNKVIIHLLVTSLWKCCSIDAWKGCPLLFHQNWIVQRCLCLVLWYARISAFFFGWGDDALQKLGLLNAIIGGYAMRKG